MKAFFRYSRSKVIQAVVCCVFIGTWLTGAMADEVLFPEQSEIDRIISQETPEGVVFLVMEHDEEALQWVLPRVFHYTRQLRAKWQDLPIAVLSHGDEMFVLVTEYQSLYKQIHASVKRLVSDYQVAFQVCAAYASMSDVSASEFPKYVDVVPFAPAEIENYRQLEFAMVSLELTW
jgi:intracellular sulfur oxidation DsrE/DsrF family protein